MAEHVSARDLLGIAPDWPTEADETRAAEERGYRRAIADLRDPEAFGTWWAAKERGPRHVATPYTCADFLESRLTEGSGT